MFAYAEDELRSRLDELTGARRVLDPSRLRDLLLAVAQLPPVAEAWERMVDDPVATAWALTAVGAFA